MPFMVASFKLLLLSLLLLASPARAAPHLECASPSRDFGAVAPTAVVSHVFTLANSGDAPLKIDWVRACCGVTADLSTNVVTAGTNATLRLTLTLDNQPGQVQKAIYVMSNDPKNPVFRLVLAAAASAGGRSPTESSR